MPIRNGIVLTALSAVATLLAGLAAHAQPFGGPPPSPGPASLVPNAEPVRSCASLADVELRDTTIESAEVDGDICRITAIRTHPPTGDRVTVWVGIPMTGWNGRFLGNGGGGFSGGSAGGINQGLAQGYAAGSTDTGHEGGSGSFALNPDGGLNWQLIRDNAHLGIHEMTETGKALTEALYGMGPQYSYFSGCSTGGRQALMEVQRYPQDYDGVVAGAPAINWPKLHVQQLWGPMLMNNEGHAVASCKLATATAAAIASCDTIDGVEDGFIEDPARCEYDPGELVGTTAEGCSTFTDADASIISRIWDGPRGTDGKFLWYGMARGADLNALSGSRGDPLQPQAMSITLDWFRYFLTQDTQFDWTTVTPAGYERLWEQSVEQFGTVIGTDNPDLSEFRDRGGKAIVWHGWSDPLITASGTVDYYKRVVREMGGTDKTEEFMRLFLAPGVGHCGGGGPTPSGQLEALIEWVEGGDAPSMLPATLNLGGGASRTRPLCPYPLVSAYAGSGSTDEAENFQCSADF